MTVISPSGWRPRLPFPTYRFVMHERPRRFPPHLADAGVVAAVAAVGLFGLVSPVLLFGESSQRVSAAGVVLVLLQAAALWWRRRSPLAVLGVTLGALLMAQALGDPNAPSYLGVPAAAYAAGAYAPRRRAMAALGGLGVAAGIDAAVVRLAQVQGPYAAVLIGPFGIFAVVAWIIGRYVAVRRAYLDMLVTYSRQLEKDRDEQARRAVRDERHRIARDLHDQVAHQLGVVSLQTGAARRWLDRDPTRTATALAAAEGAARSALETMPAILHALRADDGPADLAPQPALDSIEDLISRVSSDELTVDLQVEGSRRTLPAPVELTAYRVVQESLTNAVKHAGPARVVVALRYASDHLVVEVTDDGHGAAAPPPSGARLGLVGMRERVEMIDGTLHAGPGQDGGFAVRATLPVTG
jgi:signal transduction histidine kinase